MRGEAQVDLSFGSETGRTRSGTKGFSNKTKKSKRKKQDYHVRKRGHVQETEELDLEQVRARTTLALDRLGHQVLSTEPGGYDLDDWMRNLNSLLDDFQEKVGPDLVTDEFRERRRAALLSLARPPSSTEPDSEIERLTQEEAAAKATLAELERKAAAKLAELKDEREACEKELKAAKQKLADLRAAKQSRPFFSRLMGSGPPTEQAEARVAELEGKSNKLTEEIEKHRKVRSGLGAGSPAEGDSGAQARQSLEEAQKRLGELRSARQEMLQLSHEREVATKALSELIASMNLGPPADEGGSKEG